MDSGGFLGQFVSLYLPKNKPVTNSEITKKFKLAAKLMELHGENPFKLRSYQTISDTIYGQDQELADLDLKALEAIEGIGKGMAANIRSLVETGSFENLDKYLQLTPEGVIEMLGISGFGPKKVWTLWQEGGAETVDDLLAMCRQGKIAGLKGFAEKSQESLQRAVEFLIDCRGKLRYAVAEKSMKAILEALDSIQTIELKSETGDLRRRMEIIDRLEFLVGCNDFEQCRSSISALEGFEVNESLAGPFTWKGSFDQTILPVVIRFSLPGEFYKNLIKTTGSVNHLNQSLADGKKLHEFLATVPSEEKFYQSAGLQPVVPEMREGMGEIALAQSNNLPELVEMKDLKGILHNHSKYSDGKHTLRQMAEHCKSLGYEYLGISDHSQTAVYAGGLQEFEVKEQQKEIAALNEELAPFRIFSGIESDILNDGALDYSDEILASFDFIVASVHSGLSMDINKATNRLLAAIRNPYTTILGHMTGRLILEREGYPVDHKAVIDECAKQGVVIEINASPYRLDIDWRWVHYALEKGVMLSINPDAHNMDGYQDMYYGLLAGRKGGLTREMTLNALSLEDITKFFESKKAKAQ